MTRANSTRVALPEYEPPTGDEPLDDTEQALVRALVSALLAEIREEEAAARASEHESVATSTRRRVR